MKQITNKEYEEWQKYKAEKAKGHVLLPDTVRFICEANGYDAEKIGQYFLEITAMTPRRSVSTSLKSCQRSVHLKRDNKNASEPMWFRGVSSWRKNFRKTCNETIDKLIFGCYNVLVID